MVPVVLHHSPSLGRYSHMAAADEAEPSHPLQPCLCECSVCRRPGLGTGVTATCQAVEPLYRCGSCRVLVPIKARGNGQPYSWCYYVPQDLAVVACKDPKNRLHFGRSQFAVLREPSAVAWLRWLCKGLPPECKLFPAGLPAFRRLFTLLLARAELNHLGLTPGSLRPGGCTYF